jgi:hypothetical protein
LSRWHVLPEAPMRDDDPDWELVHAVRDDVARELEALRNAGRIGSSLDAELMLYAAPDLAARLKRAGDELRFLLLTSDARVEALESRPAGGNPASGFRRSTLRRGGCYRAGEMRALLASPAGCRRAAGTSRNLRPVRAEHHRQQRAEAVGMSSTATGQARDLGALRWLWLAVFVIVADQLTKAMIVASFQLYDRIQLLPVFAITRVHNTGAAFSFLATAGGWQRWFFITIAVAVTALVCVWLKRLPRSGTGLACRFACADRGRRDRQRHRPHLPRLRGRFPQRSTGTAGTFRPSMSPTPRSRSVR